MGRNAIFLFIVLHLVIKAAVSDDILSENEETKIVTAEEDVSDEDKTISDEDLLAAMVNTTETETEIVEKLVAALEGESESESDEEQRGTEVAEEDGKHVRFKNGQTAIKDADMMLSEEQYQLLHGNATVDDVEENEGGNHGNRTRRQAFFPGIKPWPLGIVWYMIDRRVFAQYEQGQIREAMDHWEEVSCLKFRQADMSKKPKQYLHIHDQKDGCWSMLGMTPQHTPGAQPLVLEDPGCRHFGTYLHELGHAVGLIHQHQYPTRDAFLRYYPTNVDPMMANQLEKYAPNVLKIFRTPYDLSSIMHYETISFSIDDIGPTLGIDNPWNARHIGARHRQIVSYNDAKTVNEIYQCSSKCSPLRLPCKQGYIDKNCKCVTPSSYYKKFCRDEGDTDFCNSLVPKGLCDIENYAHQKFCMKSCGFCPRFLPGQNAIGKDELKLGSGCVDRYREEPIYSINELDIFKRSSMPNPKCVQWKKAGFCQTPWMKRYCRLSCGACKSRTGRCPNYDDDLDCDDKMTQGICLNKHRDPNRAWDEGYVSFVRSRCKDSCFNCQYKEEDRDCRNKLSDEECLIKAQNDGCEKWPLKMFVDCPSTCGRCYWNKGACANGQGRDQMCLGFALKNYCKHGKGVDDDGISYDVVRKTCGKQCDTCDTTSGIVNV